MKYRSRTDIVAQILDAASGNGAQKTKIMYKAYLSYAQLKEYLSILMENGLLEENKAEKLFKTTEKGIKFMRVYGRMDELTGPLQEQKV
jgi:predicted transcriptional regulator